MIRQRASIGAILLGGCLALGLTDSAGQAPTQKVVLLNVGKGQLPGDTGLDDKTTPEIVDNVPEFPGKVLKVPFARGDSFGSKAGANKNWKRFAMLRFDAFNPAKETVNLELAVAHAPPRTFIPASPTSSSSSPARTRSRSASTR